jgi:lipoate-protein ligase B
MRNCVLRELGRVDYGEALALQQQLVAARKEGSIADQLLLLSTRT